MKLANVPIVLDNSNMTPSWVKMVTSKTVKLPTSRK